MPRVHGCTGAALTGWSVWRGCMDAQDGRYAQGALYDRVAAITRTTPQAILLLPAYDPSMSANTTAIQC